MTLLTPLGWTDAFQRKWEQHGITGAQPARVVADFGTSLKVMTPELHTAELSGKLAHYSPHEDTPKVGDWVAARLSDNGNAVIEAVIPRQSEIARKVAGRQTKKQVIAANVDVAFIVIALDNDFSVERLKRFLYQVSINNIAPVIVLNKADKVTDLLPYTEQLNDLHLPIIVSTATAGAGVEEMLGFIGSGQTAILLGSSGVGKSTLTNYLLGSSTQKTHAVRASDSSGMHTTVHRELFMLAGGGLLIDAPGIRELQLWGSEENLDESFDDVVSIAKRCRLSTCRHGDEPGCAIRAALASGVLDSAHYASYLKMKRELAELKKRSDVQERRGNKVSHANKRKQAAEGLKEMREDEEDALS
ncbi:MAG TPA: ribosome small subunit-dependent GTPase A [Patescibacteria group bacterium]|nr:ribosome small subunit-dependent GTPase A [Patescibacteria group bacterium]